MTAMLAVSLPGFMPSGTVLIMPASPSLAMRSMLGLAAAIRGVRWPSCGTGKSAMPSPRKMTYFIAGLLEQHQEDAGGYGRPDDTGDIGTHGVHQEEVSRVFLLAELL